MSEESKDIVSWEERLARDAKEMAARERPSLSQISTKAGVMSYQSQPIPGNKLLCIVVSSAFENRYYTGRFDPNKREAPKCYALSLTGEDMTPHHDVVEPESEACDTCPQYKWGSAGNGSKGKACKQVRRLGLIPAAAVQAGNVASAEVALLSVPVTSAKNWANYVNSCALEFARPPFGMLTEISIVPSAKTQFEIKFTAQAVVSDEYLAAVYKRIEGINQNLLTPYDQSGLIDETYPGEDGKKRKF